jgi:hypothetical protein
MALRLQHALGDVPLGVASMTDRSLPNLMPTVDRTLFDRTVAQSIAIDRPPPSQVHQGRATTFDALAPVVQSNFYSSGVQRRLLVFFTDGERIYHANGKPDPHYVADPLSTGDLSRLAAISDGDAVSEHQFGQLLRDARNAVGDAQTHPVTSG